MRYPRASFEIAASSPSSRTGKMHTQRFERMKQVGALACACIQHATNPRPGIPWEYFNLISNGFLPKGEKDEQNVAEGRQRYDAALAAKILAADKERPELIILAGWMHVFSVPFLEPLERAGVRIINLHPALPGKFEMVMLRSSCSQSAQGSSTEPWRLSGLSRRSRLAD